MENLNLFILIGIVIFILYFLNKPPIKNKKIKKQNIDKTNIYVNTTQNDHNIIYQENDDFYKKHFTKNTTDKEIKQINIEKGKTTRSSILSESGGSINYDNLQINTNISGNKIVSSQNIQTYRKLPTKIN